MIDDAMREELSALIDGALDAERVRALREEMESNPELQAEYDRMRRATDLVRALPTSRANIADAVASRLAGKPRGKVLTGWQWGSAFAAIAATILVVVLLNPPGGSPTLDGDRVREARDVRERSEPNELVEKSEKGLLVELEEAEESDDAPADAAPTGAESDAEAPSKSLRLRPEARVPLVVTRVEKPGAVLSRGEREQYFELLAAMDAEALTKHRGRLRPERARYQVPAKSESAKKRAAPKNEAPTRVLLARTKEEADAIAAAIARVFPPSSAEKSPGSPKVGAKSVLRSRKESELRWPTTEAQVRKFDLWVSRLGLTSGPEETALGGGVPAPAGKATESDDAGDNKKSPVYLRVRIRVVPVTKRSSDD